MTILYGKKGEVIEVVHLLDAKEMIESGYYSVKKPRAKTAESTKTAEK